MSIFGRKPWLRSAVIEIVILCMPLSLFSFISFEKRDFAAMFTFFVVLMLLFVGYIFFKNHSIYQKLKGHSVEDQSD
ncbi:hypothetical protein [Rheinheimera sp. 1928-s]|uniref:hypothetical protein n=1 Tax=Rheinheimera sp. 1928-s TaxID=3033803 RepID=UPI0026072889|nr:hypothetical protein [Rheinheimera sp. 1928-s]MDF3126466.1 hypothetical protein [Rheinheimera sp. 1928-s]